jgi:putative nucleotidyltransferase with HDIG domain
LTDLRRRIFEIKRLAAMPQIVWQLVEALGNEKTSVLELERLIESDMALATRLLSLANSAYYRRLKPVTTIKDAVIVIGFKELQVLALGVGIAGIFDLRQAPPQFDGEALWLHCMTVSWMARALAEAVNYPSPMEMMIAGLLHDLGKLLLITYFKDELKQVIGLMEDGAPYFQAEEELGLQHSLIGYWLAKRWGLPEIQVSAIRDHHEPREKDPFFMPSCIVFWADQLAKRMGFGLVQESKPVDETLILKGSTLTVEKIREVAVKAKKQIPGIRDSWRDMLTI